MEILHGLEKVEVGLNKALLGFHALIVFDFTSALYRKGKPRPFLLLKKSEDYVLTLWSLCHELLDLRKVTSFVCKMYGHKTISDTNKARYCNVV